MDALAAAVSDINMGAIAASEGDLLLHAGAVCRTDGSSMILCGPSGSGKTTLTALLAGAGLAYLTDETVRLDPRTLRLTPYRKPLSVKYGSHHLLPHLRPPDVLNDWGSQVWTVAPLALGGPAVPEGVISPGLLVLPTYEPTAELRLERLPPARAAHLLSQNSSCLRSVRGGALPALARLVRRVPAYRLIHQGDAQATATVLELLEAA